MFNKITYLLTYAEFGCYTSRSVGIGRGTPKLGERRGSAPRERGVADS